ncbi:sulfotransferase family protein [Haliea sp. E17]|uniref:sulfotransferase family protein n=1 Tax=Haliea sp. E17 TaxID=3401576 RepID=UPI003AAABFEB
MSSHIKPVFIFSLPRSGSTLLQRIIGAHPKVSTTSEPWMLLPFFYSLRDDGIFSEYNHFSMHSALQDFIQCLPKKDRDFTDAIGSMARQLYSKCSKPGDTYFLDKTPRYHLISNEIVDTFPDAKCIFLWRNPLSVIASSLDTFGNGKWRLYDYKVDFYTGFEQLYASYMRAKSTSFSLNYENLILEPEKVYEDLFAFLELDYDVKLINDFASVRLEGGAGDPTGTKKYTSLSSDPLDKWKTTLANPIRKRWSKRYLDWIGEERLLAIGYDIMTLSNELKSINSKPNYVMSDTIRIGYGSMLNVLHTNLIRKKLSLLSCPERIYSLK